MKWVIDHILLLLYRFYPFALPKFVTCRLYMWSQDSRRLQGHYMNSNINIVWKEIILEDDQIYIRNKSFSCFKCVKT